MRLPHLKHYPKTLKINQAHYSVEFVPGLEDMGECDMGNREIKIRAGLSKRETFKTLIHEVLHAYEREYELKISHALVYGLERALYATLRDNFKF